MVTINGRTFKSLNFTVLRDKLERKEKKQTYRCAFVPKYGIGELIAITYNNEFLYFANITEIYPRKLGEITLEEAKMDGFESIEEFQKTIKKLNGVKDPDQWGFIIRFNPV